MGRGAYGWVAVVAAACSGGKDTSPAGDDDDDTVVPSETGTPPDGTFTSDTGPTPHTADTGSPPPTGEVPDPYAAPFLWDTLVFDDAADLGHVPAEVPLGSQVPAGPAMFTEIGATVGLAGATSGGNSHGVGIGWVDVDNDGWHDLFVASGWNGAVHYASSLWRNQGDGTFADHTAASGLGTALADLDTYSVASGDYDADGDLDVFVTRWQRTNVMLRNNGDRTFTDVSPTVGLPTYTDRHQSASWGDIDADGDLDLFVGAYGEWTVIDYNEPAALCGDHLPDGAQLWRNEGGWFTDISDLLPPEVHNGYVFASGFYDVDDDGYPELFVSNDDGGCGPSVLVDNIGGTTFVADTESQFHPDSHDMGMAVGDLNGDELPDFALTSFKSVALLQSSVGDIGANGVFYVDAASASNVFASEAQAYGWGAEFADLDNDRDLDLAMNFGFWSTYTGPSDPHDQPDGVWVQDAAGVFSDQAATWGVSDRGMSRGVALADLNNDGWLDVAKRVLDEGTPMYVSRCGAEHWVRIKLRQGGWNTHAVGAKVRVIAGGETQVRWLQSGSSGLYTGQPLEVHVGLGDAATIDAIEVVWPDGEVSTTSTTTGIPADQVVTLTRR